MTRMASTLGAIAVWLVATAGAAAEKKAQPPAQYPSPVLRQAAAARFADGEYFRWMAADGLLKADPKKLYAAIQRAADRGEVYKVHLLSWVFTEAAPDNAAGWKNRANSAAALGLSAEAEKCAAAALDPGSGRSVPPSLMPGAVSIRPRTLEDWAASLALLAESVRLARGADRILAVKDNVSGVTVHGIDEDDIKEGMLPWATAERVALAHVGPNVFQLLAADPMKPKSVNKGQLFGAILLGAAAAYAGGTPGVDVSSLTPSMQLSGDLMANAFEVPSNLIKGSYTMASFDGQGHSKTVVAAPKTSGKSNAVETPLPILWASGGAFAPFVRAAWSANDNDDFARKLGLNSTPLDKLPAANARRLSNLYFPRLARLCIFEKCTPAVTLQEVFLDRDDLALLGVESSALPDLELWRQDYLDVDSVLTLEPGYATHGFADSPLFVAVDEKGDSYALAASPTAWLAPLPSGRR